MIIKIACDFFSSDNKSKKKHDVMMSSSAKWCQYWISVRLWGVVQSDHRDSNSAFWQSNWPDIERAGRGGHFSVCVGNTKNRCIVDARTNPFWDTRNTLPDFPHHLADAVWLLALLSIVPKSQSRENATQRQHGKNGFLLESFFGVSSPLSGRMMMPARTAAYTSLTRYLSKCFLGPSLRCPVCVFGASVYIAAWRFPIKRLARRLR